MWPLLHCIQSYIKRSIVWSVLSSSLSSALSLLKSNMAVSASALSSFRNLLLIRKSKGIQSCIFRYKSLSAYEGWLLYSTDEACVCNIQCKQRVTEKQRVILQVIQAGWFLCAQKFLATQISICEHIIYVCTICVFVFLGTLHIKNKGF